MNSSSRSQPCADAQERSPLIDVVRENTASARGIADELSYLSNGFRAVGNASVSDRLERLAADVERLAERVSRAFGRDLTERLHASEQATMNMVSAALAGISIGQNHSPMARKSSQDGLLRDEPNPASNQDQGGGHD